MYSDETDFVAPKLDPFRRPVPVDDETLQAVEVEDQTLTEADFDQRGVDPDAEKRLTLAVARYQAAHPGTGMGEAVAALKRATVARRRGLGPASLDRSASSARARDDGERTRSVLSSIRIS
jgi:hypothetical protein